VATLRARIQTLWQDVEVHVIGSCATGLNLPMSDIDLCVLGLEADTKSAQLQATTRALYELSSAVVPVLKFVDGRTGFSVDITLGASTGLASTTLVTEYLSRYPSAVPLILFLKHLLHSRRLNTLFTGGLPSYNISLMVISFLRLYHHNAASSFEDALWEAPNTNLGFCLLSFLELFGSDFPYEIAGISLKPGVGYFDKKLQGYLKPQTPQLLCLEDPLKFNVDLGVKSFAIDRVKSVFMEAFVEICDGLRDATRARDKLAVAFENADEKEGVPSRSSRKREHDQFATISRLFQPIPLPVLPRSWENRHHKPRPRSEDMRTPRRRHQASSRGYSQSKHWQ
jgi:non-canonical poly(A) RNA polymerase PAPD5/7